MDNPYLLALAKDQYGLLLTSLGEWNNAVQYLDEALEIKISNGWSSEAGKSLLHIGNIYQSEGEIQESGEQFDAADASYLRAREYYQKALSIFQEAGDLPGQARSLSNLGTINYRLYQDQEALAKFKESAAIFRSIQERSHLPGVMTNIGLVYESMGMKDSAIIYYTSSREFFRKDQDLKNWVNSNINLASIYEGDQPERSIDLLLGADSVASLIKNQPQQAVIQMKLYTIYSEQQNLSKALHHLENYQTLKDNILNSEFKTEELNVRYQTARKEELIERHKAENLQKELALTKAESENKLFLLGGSLVVVLLGGSFLIYFWRQRSKTMAQKQKDKLQKQEILTLEREKKLEAAKAMLDGQEKERLRIAEELHDRLGSTLVAARMQFDVGLDDIAIDNPHLNKAQVLLTTAVKDVRNISHNLISGVLMNLGLVPALRDLKESLEVTGRLEVDLRVDELPPLDSETELQVFRIIQELVNNSLRHAQANQLRITAFKSGNLLSFIVQDNGIGFNPEKIKPGLGLLNIERRVSAIHSFYEFTSTPGNGTTFTLKLTLTNEQVEDIAG